MIQSYLAEHEQKTIQELLKKIKNNTLNFLGYPVAKDFNYDELKPFLAYPLNNLGDPFVASTWKVDTRDLEREVIAFFAELFRAEKDDWWGYVTNGGSEGNLYGLYLARELHPKGMVYFSESTHYSVQKNLHLLGMPNITISAQENGEINYQDLQETIRMNRHMPVIIMANIGTTMTEARDDIAKIKAILKKMAIKNYYLHADGALSGSYSAFVEPRPSFDFADGVDSIAISGHKFFGTPMPCGVVVVKKNNRDRIAKSVGYIGSMDTTITGSRNGHSPLFLWYALKRHGLAGLRNRALHSLSMAAYTEQRLREIGISAWRNANAITVNFPSPSAEICYKWQLASENGSSHIICMPNVEKEQIDQLIAAIENDKNKVAVMK